MRVFVSRHSLDLQPGEGASIDWQIGERTLVIDGIDKGLHFIVESEGMSHPAAPEGALVREGRFEERPDLGRVAVPEFALWFTDGPP